ncbi:MAG: Ig-like domain-containing protein [Candidatus Aenigmatarchaeota archaeon]
MYPNEYLICGNNTWLNATVCDQESKIQGGEYFIDTIIPPIPAPWSGVWMNTLYNFTRADSWKCAVIGAFVDTSKLSDGTHYIKLRGKDTAENWGKITECLGVSFVRDTLAPETSKTLIPANDISHSCDPNEIDAANLPQGVQLTNGCQFVKAGTQIKLSAVDPDPQQTGEHADKTRIHWRVWYKVNSGDTWVIDQEGVGDENQDVTITLTKDSYHLVEYWAVDACGWEEVHHFELDIVDTKPPIEKKIVGGPHVPCDGERYTHIEEVTGEDGDCFWVRDKVTPIKLSCEDQLPHPVGHEEICYKITLDGQTDLTQQYCTQFGGTVENGWCCKDVSGKVNYTFTFQEDSVHTLQYYCIDALGNEGNTDTETFKVDSVPPTTTKTYGQPLVTTDGGYPKWINSSTPITLTAVDGGDLCAVGVDKIYWRNTIVDSMYCQSPSLCEYAQSSDDFVEYTGQFTKPEESCHLIEYYAVDLLGNQEPVKKQCVYVENTPPVSSKTLGTPKHECNESEKAQYGINDCWFMTDETPIELSCSDIGNHPVDDVKIHYKIEWKMNWEDNWQTIKEETVGNYKKFYYEDFTSHLGSYHKLTWYCVDALGNAEQEHVELDIVDTKPPVSQKTLGDPKHVCTQGEQSLYYPQMPNPTDGCYFITQQTPITLSCQDQEPHPVNHVKIYYKDWIVGNDEPEWTIVNDDHVTITKTQDSAHKLVWYCVDELGNEESTHTEYDIVDTVSPTIDISVIGPQFYNQNEDKLYIDGVTVIQVNATDPEPHPVGHVTCEWNYTVTDGQKIGQGETGLVPPFNITFPEESNHVLTIKCKDALGNEKVETRTYVVDKTPPTTTKTYGQPLVTTDGGYPKWINSSTPITLTVEDTGIHKSGIKETKYRVTQVSDNYCSEEIDCQQMAVGTGNWNTYTSPFKITQDSCHLIEYYSVDNVDKTETVKKQCVYVDNKAPQSSKNVGEPKKEVSCSNYGTYTDGCYFVNQSTPITITCTDQQPHPVDQVKIYYKIDWKNKSCDQWQNGTWIEISSNSITFTYSKDSYHRLSWYCVDALGNKENVHTELDIVDSKPPVSTKTFEGFYKNCSQLPCAASGACDYYIKQSTKIKLTCTDPDPHPVDDVKIYYRYYLDDVLKQDWTLYTGPIQYSEDSKHTLEWYCVDALGNAENVKTQVERVDTTPPETTKIIGEPKWWDESKGLYWVTSKTPITLVVKDKQEICAAGPAKLYYQIWRDSNCDGAVDTQVTSGTVSTDSNCNLNKTIYLQNECLNEIRWYAEDALGNKENGGQYITQKHWVDNTPPHLVILKPVDGWYSNGEDIGIVTQAEDLNNVNSSCEQRSNPCDVVGIGISCGNPNDCNGLGTSCAVGIENGAQCNAYLVDVERTLDKIKDKKIQEIMLENLQLLTQGTLLYNSQTKQCEGYATIPLENNLRDGVYVLVVEVADKLGNGADTLDEIGRAINERCGCDVYDMCEVECVRDAIQDIITIWNLPKIGIDNHAPVVTIVSPEAGRLFGGERVYIEANVIDSEDGQITSTITSGTPCYITLGEVSLGAVPYNNENRKCYGTIIIPEDKDMPQGEQDLTVRIADNAGNIGEGSVAVEVDTVKPFVSIISPANNQFVKGIQQIKVLATDENLDLVKVSTDNGQTWKDVTGGLTFFTYDWDTTQETDGMAYGIIAKAIDSAGNTGYSEMVIVIVDNGAPEGVYVVSPIKDEIVSGNITLKTIATDYVSGIQNVVIYVNSVPQWSCNAVLVGGTWQCELDSTSLPDGQHNVYAVATDNLGHQTTSASVPFIIDNNPPTIPSPFGHIPSIPSEDKYEYDTDGVVTWYWGPSSDEGAGVDHYILELNGEYIVVYGTPTPEGWITYTISDLFDGMYEARVRAIDKAGYESDWTNYDDVIVDKIKPSPISISTSGNENPPYDTNGNYVINWLGGTDANFDRYELYENDVNIYSGLDNSMIFTSKSDGSYEYYVTAYDKAGWSTSSKKINVIVDTIAPDISITGTIPGIGFFIATYSVSEPEPSSGIDRLVPTSDGYALCSGTFPSGFCTVFLGTQLSLTVYDKAGNSDTASTTGQEKDITPPKIMMSAPSGVINYNNIVLYAKTDEPATCYYDTFDNVGTMNQMNTSDSIEHQAIIGTLADGLYVYHIRCQDLSGNMMEQSKTIVFAINTESQFCLVIPPKGPNNPGGYWNAGWNTFVLPQLILEDIYHDGPYPVQDILSSLYEDGVPNFEIIWYYNGTQWLYFDPEHPEYSTLLYFNDTKSLPYYIKMNQEDRLELSCSEVE